MPGSARGARLPNAPALLPYILRRLWQIVPTLAGVILLVFFLFNAVGGDPAVQLAGLISNPAQIAAIRKELGLDLPIWQQLLIFVKQVATFDFGSSWATNEAVSHILTTRLPATLTVMLPVLVLDIVLGVTFSLAVAAVRGTLTDRAIMIACTVAVSISFLVYIIVFQWLFAFQLGWFPVQGWSDSTLRNLVRYAPLPIVVTVLVNLAPHLRLYRSFLLDEIGNDYVRTARAKGLSERVVMLKHVLRNAMIPILTNISIQVPTLFVGAFLVEVFFSIPGLGREVVTAVNRSDFPVIKATTVFLAMVTIVVNLAADVMYKVVDPRVTFK